MFTKGENEEMVVSLNVMLEIVSEDCNSKEQSKHVCSYFDMGDH